MSTVAGSLLLKLEAFPREAASGAAFSAQSFSQSGGTLGRVPGNDWVLADPYISRQHAEFRFIDGQFCVIDKGSTGGISVDGETPIDAHIPYRLKSGDRLLIGSFDIHVRIIEVPDAADAPETDPLELLSAARPSVVPATSGPSAAFASTCVLDSAKLPAAPPPVSRVQMTAFGPGVVQRGLPFHLQTIFHPVGGDVDARALAELPEKGSQVAQVLPLPGRESEGQNMTVRLHGESRVTIDEPEQRFLWRGDLIARQFEVRLPWVDWRSDFSFTVDVEVGGCPIGRCKFRVTLADGPQSGVSPAVYGTLSRYECAFLSYAAEDASMVADLAQLLEIQGLRYFLDKSSVRAGAEWQAELQQHIESSDLFLLCWSRNAAKSAGVAKEIAWALSAQRRSGGLRPDIRPFVLDGPLLTAPPQSLQHLNFNSPARFLRRLVD